MAVVESKPSVQKSSVGNPDADMSIVLVCWNNKAYLDPCLKSLYEGGLKSSFDVVVVDNGSTDGSQDMLVNKYPEVKLIQMNAIWGSARRAIRGLKPREDGMFCS